MHPGEDDQIVLSGAAALQAATLGKNATLHVAPGLPHGMCSTHKEYIKRGCARVHHE
jgi:non-heme chloroperoxidase